jgi:hypothetical protein
MALTTIATLAAGRIGASWRWGTDFLCGRDGKLSNPKLMGWAIFWATVLGHPLPIVLAGMLLAASFGYKAWSEWVNKGTWSLASTESQATVHTLVETVQQRRDPVAGVEATP